MRGLRIALVSLLVTLCGCGIEWFPEYKQQPTDPNPFSFAPKTGVDVSSTVTSEAITVQGLKADSTSISVSGPSNSNSQYSINAGSFTSAAGTVKNGDTVQVQHTSSSVAGGQVTTTLTIGAVSGTFTSTATTVLPLFTPITKTAAPGTLVTSDGVALNISTAGNHSISITNGSYSFSRSGPFVTTSQPSVFLGANPVIFLQNTALPTSGAQVVTTLTVDGRTGTMTTTAQ